MVMGRTHSLRGSLELMVSDSLLLHLSPFWQTSSSIVLVGQQLLHHVIAYETREIYTMCSLSYFLLWKVGCIV